MASVVSSGLSFSVSQNHNSEYNKGTSRRNPFLNGRTSGPRMSLQKKSFEPTIPRGNSNYESKVPEYTTKNFPKLNKSSRRSVVGGDVSTGNKSWTAAVATKPIVSKSQINSDEQTVVGKTTQELYKDTHMFKKKSNSYDDYYERTRQEEYEEQLRYEMGDDEYYEWKREQEEDAEYYDECDDNYGEYDNSHDY